MISKRTLDLNDAKRMVQAAEDLASKQKWRLSIAIVDDGGHLILLHRMDGAPLSSIDIAQKKAVSALFYRTPTRTLEQGVAAGKSGLAALPDAIAFEGGLPVIADNEMVGAVGVSGALPHEDGEAAKTACENL